jgi:carboxymethylenebutenolidase
MALTPGLAERGGRLLYLSGADDHVISADQAGILAEELTKAGVRHEIVVYPGVPHGFLADERDTYRSDIAENAWRRIDEFFAEGLRT